MSVHKVNKKLSKLSLKFFKFKNKKNIIKKTNPSKKL